MGIFTRDQIVARITDITNAIDSVLLGQTYSIDTGHGRQSVTRASLPQLRDLLQEWERRLEEIDGDAGRFASIRGVRG